MTTRRQNIFNAGSLVTLSLCVLLAAGCSKPDEPAGGPPAGTEAPGGNRMGGPGGGPGGPGGGPGGGMRGPGGRGAPVAENATGAEIYQAKCGCHGQEGKGGRAPVLTSVASRSDSDLYTIVHDGRDKMPAFGSQLSEAQIKKVVTQIKTFK